MDRATLIPRYSINSLRSCFAFNKHLLLNFWGEFFTVVLQRFFKSDYLTGYCPTKIFYGKRIIVFVSGTWVSFWVYTFYIQLDNDRGRGETTI